MIIRLVKMSFRSDACDQFEQIFEQSKAKIKAMPGCKHVELLKEVKEGTTYFTRSIWDSEDDLNFYRNSNLFKGVWKKTKALFNAKPEAWTTTLEAYELDNEI